MAKSKKVYVCSDCGHDSPSWAGQCGSCKAWNTLNEMTVSATTNNSVASKNSNNGWLNSADNKIKKASEINVGDGKKRLDTKNGEFNRVLGGGLTVGSVNIISGAPGAGKSTLLIQIMASLSTLENQKCLYVTGEESLSQVKARGERLKLDLSNLLFLAETNVEKIIEVAQQNGITVITLDSIQTLYTNNSSSSAGSTSQVKESGAMLTKFAKNDDISMFVVGHITKDGIMAGPKVLEHMVDSSIQIDGDKSSRYRMARASKNRFGDASEMGVFAMTEKGMIEVKNPSAIFINSDSEDVSGSAIFVSQEGNRPLLFEVQTLVTESFSEKPMRLSLGINYQRVAMLLAILQKHNNFRFFDKDVYVNVVGGIQIPSTETSCDLGVCFSIYSSNEEIVIPKDIAAFGEIALSGEIRPVQNGEGRIKEAEKHGFKYIFVPKANTTKKLIEKSKIQIIPVSHVSQAVSKLHEIIG
jgi:DNA repair protein RadA/Sms